MVLTTIVLGLASRSTGISLPSVVSAYAGDILWAAMVYLIFCAIFIRQKPINIFMYSLLFSFVIEFSQFNHEPWIGSIRDTTLGGLVLGYGFKVSDLACYLVGLLVAFTVDRLVLSRVISQV